VSISDALRHRDLEAQVAALTARVTELENRREATAGLAQRINLLQGQLSMLRRNGTAEPPSTTTDG
jgi:hypothetical protein